MKISSWLPLVVAVATAKKQNEEDKSRFLGFGGFGGGWGIGIGFPGIGLPGFGLGGFGFGLPGITFVTTTTSSTTTAAPTTNTSCSTTTNCGSGLSISVQPAVISWNPSPWGLGLPLPVVTVPGFSFSINNPFAPSGSEECCQYDTGSADFNACCDQYGSCPNCEGPCSGCRNTWFCQKKGGTCRKVRCETGERQVGRCRGRRCKCCKKPEVTVTTNCTAAAACCGIAAGTADFYACCAQYGCCPVCATPGCTYNNTEYAIGDTIVDLPDKCYRLTCQAATSALPPYTTGQLVEDQASGCGCCSLGGRVYPDGYLLTDDGACISIQCVQGNWTNQEFFSANCRTCRVQDPLVTVLTFDGTRLTIADDQCKYTLTEEGTSSVVIGFANSSNSNGFTQSSLTVTDTAGIPLTCPASDPYSGCDFGALTSSPTEVSDGTLGFTWNLAGIDYSVLVGENGITTLYNPNTLLLFSDNSNENQLGGICGQYNGDPSDDLTLPDGTLTTDTSAFISAWQDSCLRSDIVALSSRGLECTIDNEQEVHDHCYANTIEHILSMYDAQDLEQFFADLDVSEILSQSGLDVDELLSETVYDVLGSLGISQENVDEVISEVSSITGEDLTGLGDSTIEDFINDNDLSDDQAALYILGIVAVNASTSMGYDLQEMVDMFNFTNSEDALELVDVMGMQFLSLMYTFNVSLEGVFDDNWCGDNEECLLGSLVEDCMKLACMCGDDATDAESDCMHGVHMGTEVAMEVAMRTRNDDQLHTLLEPWWTRIKVSG